MAFLALQALTQCGGNHVPTIPQCQSRNWCMAKTFGCGMATALMLAVTLVAFYKGFDYIGKAVRADGGVAAAGNTGFAALAFAATGVGAYSTYRLSGLARAHWNHIPAAPQRAPAMRTGQGQRLGSAPTVPTAPRAQNNQGSTPSGTAPTGSSLANRTGGQVLGSAPTNTAQQPGAAPGAAPNSPPQKIG